MKVTLRIENDGRFDAELNISGVTRWISVTIDESQPDDFRASELTLTVWENSAPEMFKRFARAFDIDLGELDEQTTATRHVTTMPA